MLSFFSGVMLLFSVFLFLTLPFLLLWDLIAFIIFIAAPKSDYEKRRKAETGFIKSSAIFTAALIVTVTLYTIAYLMF